jgi:hypothetical protein
MPDLVESLCYVNKSGGAVFLTVEGGGDPVDDAVRLLDGGVFPSEAELMGWY